MVGPSLTGQTVKNEVYYENAYFTQQLSLSTYIQIKSPGPTCETQLLALVCLAGTVG